MTEFNFYLSFFICMEYVTKNLSKDIFVICKQIVALI